MVSAWLALAVCLCLGCVLGGGRATVLGARRVQLTESIECFAGFGSGPALWNTFVAMTNAAVLSDVDKFATVVAQISSGLRAGRPACAVFATVLRPYNVDTDGRECEAWLAGTPWVRGQVPVTDPLLVCLRNAEATGRSMILTSSEDEEAMKADAAFRLPSDRHDATRRAGRVARTLYFAAPLTLNHKLCNIFK
jgi:hypothetical protein